MSSVAFALRIVQYTRNLERQPRGLPATEAARDRANILVAKTTQVIGREQGANPTCAESQNGRVRIWRKLFNAEFQEAAHDTLGAVRTSLRDLIGLAHVDQDGTPFDKRGDFGVIGTEDPEAIERDVPDIGIERGTEGRNVD